MLNKIQILKTSIAIVTMLAPHTQAMEAKEGGAKIAPHEAPSEGKDALEVFKKHMAAMDQVSLQNPVTMADDARLRLAKFIHQSEGKELTESQWEAVYFGLFSLAGVQSPEYVQKNYQDVMQVLEQNWHDFDRTLQKPVTEGGFFSDDKVRIIKPLDAIHTTIVFGGGLNAYTYEPKAYLVNILSTPDYIKLLEARNKNKEGKGKESLEAYIRDFLREGSEVDMVADMNSSKQLARLPDNRFASIYVEDVPAQDYWNPHFFQNAKRILQEDGMLFINAATADVMKGEPYNIRDFGAYFGKNGFQFLGSIECSYPRIDKAFMTCFYLKKKRD